MGASDRARRRKRSVSYPSRHRVWFNLRQLLVGFGVVAIAVAIGWVVLLTATCAINPSLHASVPERVWRHLKGEPGATQDVNDAADILERGGECSELEGVADEIMRNYAAVAATLPEAEYDIGRAIPVENLPKRFHQLRGTWHGSPQVILRLDQGSKATQVRLNWGHGRHSIVVFADGPSEPPKGFYVRRVSPRTYVLAAES